MRASFWGVEVGVALDQGVHLCGVRGPNENHVLFQRGESDLAAADIYFEFKGQAHGGYDLVLGCHLSRKLLSLELSRPIDSMPEMQGIDVTLEVDDDSFRALAGGLVAIFLPCPERLVAV